MKKTNLTVMFAALVGFMFTACTSDTLEFSKDSLDNSNAANAEVPVTFGTYMGKSGTTRNGTTGSITTTTLTTGAHKDDGFGVFAYYTGTEKYGHYQSSTYYGEEAEESKRANHVANFMFNQQVKYDDAAYTKWAYTPIKYWPNEVESPTNTSVDDQDENKADDPAISAGANGGKISFFAYAPYVPLSSTALSGTGITKINGETTLTAANVKTGDPKITYQINTTGENVDLLWGTYDSYNTTTGTNENVISETVYNQGVGYDHTANANTYQLAILPHKTGSAETDYNGYKLNADLTKQKTTGKIGFNFKHALAKVGGSQVNPSTGGPNPTNGLMVVLDIDQNGAETGGEQDKNTIVTIESIKIETNEMKYDSDRDGDIDGDDAAAAYVVGGEFNLATGKWESYITGGSQITHTITSPKYVKDKEDASETNDGVATLNTTLAEPTTFSAINVQSTEGTSYYNSTATNTGVTRTRKNVYASEANPFVFIPGTKPSFNITVAYYVRTYDPNLATTASGEGTWTKVKQVIKKKVTFADMVELNKQYNLLMHLGLTSVKFTATVSNWSIDGDKDDDGVIEQPGEEVKLSEDVYLPINVSELTAVTSSVKYVGSLGGEFQIPDLSLDYSYDNDDLTNLPSAKFAEEKITFEAISSFIAVDATGKVTFEANESNISRVAKIKVKRGNITTGNFQSATLTFLQKGATLTGLVLSLAPSESVAATLSTTATATATYTHTTYQFTGSATAFNNDVSLGATYTIDGSGTISKTATTLDIGFAAASHTVTATYNSDSYDTDAALDTFTAITQTATATVTTSATFP